MNQWTKKNVFFAVAGGLAIVAVFLVLKFVMGEALFSAFG